MLRRSQLKTSLRYAYKMHVLRNFTMNKPANCNFHSSWWSCLMSLSTKKCPMLSRISVRSTSLQASILRLTISVALEALLMSRLRNVAGAVRLALPNRWWWVWTLWRLVRSISLTRSFGSSSVIRSTARSLSCWASSQKDYQRKSSTWFVKRLKVPWKVRSRCSYRVRSWLTKPSGTLCWVSSSLTMINNRR